MSLDFGLFCKCTSLASDHPHRLVLLLEYILRRMVQDKPDALFVRLEPKLFGNETYIYIGFVSALLAAPSDKQGTYALQMTASADSRCRSTNISMR